MQFESDHNKPDPNFGLITNADHAPMLFKTGADQNEIDRTLWAQLKAGNRKALDFIYEKYVRLLFAYGIKIWKDDAKVEDSIQDVFLELWHRRTNLSDTDNIKFYLLRSVRRRIERTLQKEQSEQVQRLASFDSDEVELSLEAKMIQIQQSIEQQELLTKAISRLSQRQQEAVHLKFYEKLNYVQLSQILGIDLKSTYKLIGKAIDTLRKAVQLKN
ncbi:MAG: sigma-70 family RNA polymerase sigma factor [Cyclobacteriaceae bacterium]|nr:sigma-70 family RNA polymerase sigma factor [Cyclobacteriaceae bacterium]